MANLWVASGTSYITAPTLGNVTASKVRVEQYIDVTTSGVGYLFGQAPLSNTQREFGLYITDVRAGNPRTIDFAFGGTLALIGNVTDIFGTATPKGLFDFQYDKATTAWFLKLDGVTKASGTAATGTARIDGTLWRMGARSNDNAVGGTTAGYISPSGWKFGDQKIWINDALVRDYAMPLTGTDITESVSGANATLRSGTGSGDFIEYVPPDPGADTTPDAGSFGAKLGAALSTATECQDYVTIAGITAATDVAASPSAGTEICVSADSGGSYSAWTSTSQNVQLGYRIKARKVTSAYNSATVFPSVTVGGTVFDGQISTLAVGSRRIKNVVFIGASIEEQPFGRSLTVPHAATNAALVAAGVTDVNFYGYGFSTWTGAQVAPKIAEAVAAFPNDDTLFLYHPFGNDVSNTRPYSSMTGGEITAFNAAVDACIAALGSRRLDSYCAGISFRSYANPITNKTIFNDQSQGSLPYLVNFVIPKLLPHELNTDGFPVYDYYNKFRNQNETIIQADGIHPIDPSGRVILRNFVGEMMKYLLVDGVKPPPIVPAANYLAPPTSSATTKTAYIGVARLGTFAVYSGSAVNTYTLTGTNAALFNIGSSTAIVDFKVAPAATGTGSVGVTTTNALGSSTQTINYTVEEYVAPVGDGKQITAKGVTAVGITARGCTAVGL